MSFETASGKLIVTGASGMLGSALRKRLADARIPTIRLVRQVPSDEGQLQWNPAAEVAVNDPTPLEGARAAIHLSGANVAAHRWTDAYRREMVESRVRSTRQLAGTLAALRKPPRSLLVASATGFYGDRGDEMLSEISEPGNGFLAELCQRWEAAAQPAVDAGIRVVHLRFGVVLGPGEGALKKMLPLFRWGLGARLGTGKQWMSWVSLADAIGAVLFVLDRADIAGPVNVTTPNPVTNGDFTRALARALGRPAFLAMPAFALRIMAGQMADEALLVSERVKPEKLMSTGFQFSLAGIDAALRAAIQNGG